MLGGVNCVGRRPERFTPPNNIGAACSGPSPPKYPLSARLAVLNRVASSLFTFESLTTKRRSIRLMSRGRYGTRLLKTLHGIVLENGERLPCLVDSTTGLPVRVGTRWVVRHRRYRVQSSSLASNLRDRCRLYCWTLRTGGFDLDNFLTAGNVLDSRQLESLANGPSLQQRWGAR